MLAMLTLHMQEFYNHHSEFDVEHQFRQFTLKYGQSIQGIRADCDIEPLNHHDVFKLFQRKSANKCSGWDGWAVAELHQLPPCGWVGFTFVMRLAEVSGVWPPVIRTVSVSSIAKHDTVRSPEDTRAIGISSVIYSVWSSLGLRQLSGWSNRVFPYNIPGGVKGRNADASELALSLDLASEREAC